jgi:hypothetical protein
MSIVVQVNPDHPEDFDYVPDLAVVPEIELASRLQSAYEYRFSFYEKQINDAYNLLSHHPSEFAHSRYPSLAVVFDEEEDEVVFDSSLYEVLLETYIFEGWDGILRVEAKLEERLSAAEEDAPSAGVYGDKRSLWGPVKNFFRFTRNLVAILIHDALIRIERKASVLIFNGLSHSEIQVAIAWEDKFRIALQETVTYYGKGSVTKRAYKFNNTELSDALYKGLSNVVKQKYELDRSLKRLYEIQWKVEQVAEQRYRSNYKPTPYVETEEDLDRQKTVVQEAEALLKEMRKMLYDINSLGLLLIDGLPVDFTREKMEQTLAAALYEIRERIGDIRRSIDPDSSLVAAAWRAVNIEGDNVASNANAIEAWKAPDIGLERFISETALKNLTSNQNWFSLAHEDTWHRLVETRQIAKDSFEYVVYTHYVSVLIDSVQNIRAKEEVAEKFLKGFGIVAAALSLGSLATPVTAGAYPLLRSASQVADLALLVHSIHSVSSNLARLNDLLSEELVNPDAFGFEHLARIGELAQLRRDAIEQIPQQILIELGVTAIGAKWAAVKKLTLLHGYIFDLETLLDETENEEVSY